MQLIKLDCLFSPFNFSHVMKLAAYLINILITNLERHIVDEDDASETNVHCISFVRNSLIYLK